MTKKPRVAADISGAARGKQRTHIIAALSVNVVERLVLKCGYDKLRDLGFTQRAIDMYGKPRYIFEHKTIANAMIILPKRDPRDPVEPFHLGSVLTTLKAHSLVPECNPLAT